MEGYIKLYRELFEKPIWLKSTPEQKAILITLLLMANHKEKSWEWQGEKFFVKPGQFITSLEKVAEKAGLGISIQNVRTAIERFRKLEFLTNESTKTGRLITITNWELYQIEDVSLTKTLTISQQRPNKDLTTNKNDKECKNDKELNNISDSFSKIINSYTQEPKLQTAIVEFIQYRKEIKKSIKSDKSLNALLEKLTTLSQDASEKIQIFKNSMANGWQGIFPIKKDAAKGGSKTNIPQHNNFKQRNYDDEFYESLYENTESEGKK